MCLNKGKARSLAGFLNGGDEETRTLYLDNANVALYQMSYIPKIFMVGRRGLEPRTNCLKGNCSTIELASRLYFVAYRQKSCENMVYCFRQCKLLFA